MSTMVAGHPHIKVTDGGCSFEHCEDPGCVVDPDGHAGCGRLQPTLFQPDSAWDAAG